MRYLLFLAAAAGLVAAADMSLTVEKLKAFIASTVQLRQSDAQVAQYLHHVKMTEKLDDRTVEELQNEGAGLKTVAALRELVEASAKLPEPTPPPPKPVYTPKPPPSSVDQAKIIDETRDYVMNYTKGLPNFICVQVTRRDVDPSGSGTQWSHARHHHVASQLRRPERRLPGGAGEQSAGHQHDHGTAGRHDVGRRVRHDDERDLRTRESCHL